MTGTQSTREEIVFISTREGNERKPHKDNKYASDFACVKFNKGRKKDWRRHLPVPRDEFKFSLISFLKSTIGKDLTRVAIPVNFNEPLSFLQRLAENFEYASVITKAAECTSTTERLAYIAAFASSVYAGIPGRWWKPFNPILGETFEYVDEEKGIAAIAEQVSHHPPVTALHGENEKWIFTEEYNLDTKFRGYYVKICPTGNAQLRFKADGYHYTWNRVPMTIHNIILGELWADFDGDTEVICHQTNERAVVHFTPHKRSHDHKKLKGEVYDSQGQLVYNLEGTWDEGLEATHVYDSKKIELWKAVTRTEDNYRNYGFTYFTLKLNQLDEGVVCPTDTRFRPDQRLMEHGKIDEAADSKYHLEEKQRHARKRRERNKETWKPRWFEKTYDDNLGKYQHVYTGKYWKAKEDGNYEDCPDLF